MKKILIFALMLALALSTAACGSSGGSAGGENPYAGLRTTVLTGGDSTGEGSVGQLFGQYFSERVTDITEGSLSVNYHPNGKLGGDLDLLGMVKANRIQIVVCQTAPMVSFIPEMAVFDLPMVFAEYDGDRIDAVLNGHNAFTERLNEACEKQGFHLLGFLQNGTYRLTTSNRDLSSLEDFKGLRIRTMENENQMDFWSALGAEPTPLPWSKVYEALRDGTVEAQENAADTIYAGSLQNVQRYLACTDHLLYCNVICINNDAWQSLDPAYRAALEQAAAEAVAYMRPLMKDVDAFHKQKLVESGMTLIEYDDEFYDSVLALEGVRALRYYIDKNQSAGLGALLTEELNR